MAGSGGVERVDRAVKAARRRGWAVGLGIAVGALVLGSLVDQMSPDSSWRDLARLADQLLLVASPAFGIRAYARALPSTGVVVWLRRFHTERSRTFGALLERASLGIGYPLTLQDSRYAWSISRATARGGLLVPLAMVLWLFGWLAVLALVMFGLHQQDGAALVLVTIVWTVLYLQWVAGWAKRLGFRTVSATAAEQQLLQILRTRGEGRRLPVLGVEVLKVEDAGWQKLVRGALDGAALAVIDVTEVTDNLRWELATAFGTLGPERLILAAEDGAAADVDQVWRQAVAPVRDASPAPLTRDWVAAALFVYPSGRPTGVSPRFRRDAERLRAMMLSRLLPSSRYSRA